MPLDQSFVGRTYPPTEPYEVGREKIREFARAIGDSNLAYHDVAAARALGHADVIAPPTFAIVISSEASGQVIFDPALGLDYSRVVHGEQRFDYVRPITAGDRLVGVVSVDSIRRMAGSDVLVTKCALSTEAGEPVVVAYGTLVARADAS